MCSVSAPAPARAHVRRRRDAVKTGAYCCGLSGYFLASFLFLTVIFLCFVLVEVALEESVM